MTFFYSKENKPPGVRDAAGLVKPTHSVVLVNTEGVSGSCAILYNGVMNVAVTGPNLTDILSCSIHPPCM